MKEREKIRRTCDGGIDGSGEFSSCIDVLSEGGKACICCTTTAVSSKTDNRVLCLMIIESGRGQDARMLILPLLYISTTLFEGDDVYNCGRDVVCTTCSRKYFPNFCTV